MRNKLILAIVAAFGILSAKADVVNGTVSDGSGKPVEYATVVALSADSIQQAGTVTNAMGKFEMHLPKGKYRLVFTLVGYDRAEKDIALDGTLSVKAKMKETSIMMEEVEVTASAIRREPDRFVVMVENMPGAVGKDGRELLRESPGVWIDDDRISINGRTNPKIYVNDRELRMDNEQLQAYLRSLKAEDISKVEVIPQSGVEYNADSSSGIIKITLKRNRADGVMGNVGLSGEYGDRLASLNPSAAVNVKKGKWTFNLNGNYSHSLKRSIDMNIDNNYTDNNSHYTSTSTVDDKNMHMGNVLGGIFYDHDAKNSFGLEVNYANYRVPKNTATTSTFSRKSGEESIRGSYNGKESQQSVDATFNYVHRLDSLGSTMKTIANYSGTHGRQDMDNRRSATLTNGLETPPVQLPDSVYRSLEHTNYDVANVSYDFDKVFNQKWSFSAGAKYTMNRMDNDATYDHFKEQWITHPDQNYDYVYTENIGALYAKGSAKFGRLSALAGIRFEYTDAGSHGSIVAQNYFDFFPNARLTYSLDAMSANSLTLSYSRYISRPSFWSLNPIRNQASDYMYQAGNPDLKPSYQNNISLTGVYKYRYTLTLWTDIATDAMQQGTMPDPRNPENVLFTTVNADNIYSYGAALNLPFQFTKWWSLNLGVTYVLKGQRMKAHSPLDYNDQLSVVASTGFQLPKEFYISGSYFYMKKFTEGTSTIGPLNFLSFSVKKTFNNRKWTVALNANNVLSKAVEVRLRSMNYVSTMKMDMPASVGLSVTYNFNAGKIFQAKSIESNADESRTQQSGLGDVK